MGGVYGRDIWEAYMEGVYGRDIWKGTKPVVYMCVEVFCIEDQT